MKAKMMTNLNDISSLQDTTPIIDYMQLWLKHVPYSWYNAIEDPDNKLSFSGDTYLMENTDSTYIFKLQGGEKLILNKTGQCGKLYIPSKSIKPLKYWTALPYIKRWISDIKPLKPVRLPNGNKLPSLIHLSHCMLTRIDLCINIVNEIDLNSLYWYTHKDTTIFRYFNNVLLDKNTKENVQNVTGITVGKRGSDLLHCRLYKKWLDPNRFSALQKFHSTQFYRLEYEIRRKQIQRVKTPQYKENITKYNENIKSLNDLCSLSIKRLWKYVLSIRYPKLNYLTDPVKINDTFKDDKQYDAIHQKRYDMTKGLLKPYRLSHPDEHKHLTDVIDKIFKFYNIKKKPDDIDIYNQEGIA